MPENLTRNEVNSQTDPSVTKQYDNETSKEQQIKDLFKLIDGQKISMLSTYRDGVGPVGRSMAVAQRNGPDILYLSNQHSTKFQDLSKDKECQITFQDTKTQNWISISGTATTTSNSDPRIKDVWSRGVAAWFGDLGDGKHDGGPDDPRMSLIEVKAKYVTYYQTDVGLLGMAKEVGVAAVTGKVAETGKLRELTEADIEQARKME
ncbi:blue light-inducible protein-like protein Bli-3 [Massarina eburnea CBS 473.64]|uniref:Blue light-inducible protein-like protein Bli-3 n=1 Tax=Massarina eburnea CBS 473.64 TaxID=1395130 RepID=A0A6A6S0F4_9PLEO|nr:blue light-inducible protein-like protein Bli-3 [Massarina eburnea CBS 473.64]